MRPDVPVLLTTGYSDRYSDEGARGIPVLAKPYSIDQLSDAIGAAIARPGADGAE